MPCPHCNKLLSLCECTTCCVCKKTLSIKVKETDTEIYTYCSDHCWNEQHKMVSDKQEKILSSILRKELWMKFNVSVTTDLQELLTQPTLIISIRHWFEETIQHWYDSGNIDLSDYYAELSEHFERLIVR
jgi:hypothetical protein